MIETLADPLVLYANKPPSVLIQRDHRRRFRHERIYRAVFADAIRRARV